MSYRARQVIADMDWSEKEAEFWEQHADRLTPDEAERIATGDFATLLRPVPPTWTPGQWIAVASNLWIRPSEPTWRRHGVRVAFDVKDFRPRLVRRVPQVFDPPELDSHGDPKPPSPLEIEKARQDGSYTRAADLAVPEDEEAVEDSCLNLYAATAHAKRALGDSERTEERIAEIHRLPPTRRIVELHKLASERGIDVRDDFKAFERRVLKRLGRAA